MSEAKVFHPRVVRSAIVTHACILDFHGLISIGKKVYLAFELTVNGSPVRVVAANRPMKFIQGHKVPGLPKALAKHLSGMRLGERKRVMLKASQGFGVPNPSLIMELPRIRFAKRYHWVGSCILSEKDGKPLAVVKAVRKEMLVVDFNHPLAGKDLQYDLHIVGIDGEGMISPQERTAG